MTTPEERLDEVWKSMYRGGHDDPTDHLDMLLAYFDEHEPALADAIRYGLAEVEDCPDYGCNLEMMGLLKINYPPDHPKA
jgi:hypothetical protein